LCSVFFFRRKAEWFVFNVFSSLDVGLKWFVFYVLHPVGRRTERFVFNVYISLDVGLSASSSMFYILFGRMTERFVFCVLYLLWTYR